MSDEVLVIDTHGTYSLVAGGGRDERVVEALGREARRPLADLGERVAEVESALGQVSAIGVVVGPGGLLSVRAGVAFARAYAAQKKIPLVPVSTFLAVARSLSGVTQDVVVVEPAGRGEVVFAVIDPAGVGEVVVADPSSFIHRSALVAGSAAERVGALGLCAVPTAQGLVTSCLEVLERDGGRDPRKTLPTYLRPPDARKSFEVRNPDGTFSWLRDPI